MSLLFLSGERHFLQESKRHGRGSIMKVNKILTDVVEAALMTPVLFTGGLASSMPPLPRP